MVKKRCEGITFHWVKGWSEKRKVHVQKKQPRGEKAVPSEGGRERKSEREDEKVKRNPRSEAKKRDDTRKKPGHKGTSYPLPSKGVAQLETSFKPIGDHGRKLALEPFSRGLTRVQGDKPQKKGLYCRCVWVVERGIREARGPSPTGRRAEHRGGSSQRTWGGGVTLVKREQRKKKGVRKGRGQTSQKRGRVGQS